MFTWRSYQIDFNPPFQKWGEKMLQDRLDRLSEAVKEEAIVPWLERYNPIFGMTPLKAIEINGPQILDVMISQLNGHILG